MTLRVQHERGPSVRCPPVKRGQAPAGTLSWPRARGAMGGGGWDRPSVAPHSRNSASLRKPLGLSNVEKAKLSTKLSCCE